MSRILVTGGSHAEIPLIKALKNLGHYVITTGNNTDGLGHKIADRYVPGDFSDMDFVYNLAKDEAVTGIISGCNDFAYLSSAYAAEKLGFSGHDTYEVAKEIHHKNKFRDNLKKCGLNLPECRMCYSESEVIRAAETIGYPVLIKPVDLTGGKGVKRCNNCNELLNAYKEAISWTRQVGILVEKFIVGSSHGISCLLKNQKVIFSFIDNEEYYLNDYLVSGAYTGIGIDKKIIRDIENDISILAKELKLCDGLFHCQLIIDDSNKAFMIDPCRRAPGDLYIKLVEYASGVDYPLAIVEAELGIDFTDALDSKKDVYNIIARECIMASQNGLYEDVYIDDTIKDKIIDKLIWGIKDEPVDDYTKYKAGIVFIKYEDEVIAESCQKNIYDRLYANVK